MYAPNNLMRFLALLIMASASPAFLFDKTCVAPSPCTCFSDTIYCNYKQLSSVPSFTEPSFTEYSEYYRRFTIDLENNKLTTIPHDSFQNLSSLNSTTIELRLQDNFINQIEDHAFNGIENSLTALYLQNNNLQYLPSALKELAVLQNFDVTGNPLTGLDAMVLSVLGNTLRDFRFTADHFPVFPSSLHFLGQLMYLTISKIQQPFLHADVFHGIEASLTTLELPYSRLESIPSAVCSLRNLQTFTFTYSSNLLNSSLFDECHQRVTSIKSLELASNHLETFPLISVFAPHVQTLSLFNNNLKQIESSSLPSIPTLTSLDLRSNSLTRIPASLNKLINLERLDVANNHITSVEDNDLLQLHQLRYLYLGGNPLTSISPKSFEHNPLLYSVNLHSAGLDHIPQAFTKLPNLQHLYCQGMRPQCTCNEMSYLKHWNLSSIFVRGECRSGENLQTYLINILPNCP